jgi:hypothetical protein
MHQRCQPCLVAWWMAENRALERAQKALRLRHINPFDHEEPFAAVIRCTADPSKVDKRTRSKWSRASRYAISHKPIALKQDLLRLRTAWKESQASRDRDAIYTYLTAVAGGGVGHPR